MRKIWICILMDMLGLASYLLPIAGEWTDILWAPVSACIFYKLIGGRYGQVGALINFLEEIIPFTDIIPTFTLMYFYEKQRKRATVTSKQACPAHNIR